MAPKIKPIRRDSKDVSAMLIPCRLELLMKPSASSVITDVLIRKDIFIAENLQGNTISKSTFIHHLYKILNSRTDTSRCYVHEVHFIQSLTGNFWPQRRFSHFETAVLNSSSTNSLPGFFVWFSFVFVFFFPLFPALRIFGFINF